MTPTSPHRSDPRRRRARDALRVAAVVTAVVVSLLAVAPPWVARAGPAPAVPGVTGRAPGPPPAPGDRPGEVAAPAGPGPAPGRSSRVVGPLGDPPPDDPRRPHGPVAPPPRPPGAGVPAPGADYSWPLLPVPTVTGVFRKPTFRYGRGHRGADLAGTPGGAVLAAREGTVVFAGRIAGRGVVSVDHPDGLRSTYEPVTASVTAGATVAAGDPLGVLEPGHPGCPVAACLHWGVRRDRLDHLDPLVLLRPPRVRLLPWDGAGS